MQKLFPELNFSASGKKSFTQKDVAALLEQTNPPDYDKQEVLDTIRGSIKTQISRSADYSSLAFYLLFYMLYMLASFSSDPHNGLHN